MEYKEKATASGQYLQRANMDDGKIELAEDFLLPEHLDDAKKIIRCDGTLRPGGRYVNGREVEYEGEMVYSVLYITDTNSVKNAVFKAKYNRNFQIPEDAEQDFSVFPTASEIECRLVNPRKMNLRAQINLHFDCVKTMDASPVFQGESAEEDKISCEKRAREAEYLRTVTVEKKENRVSRDFELDSGAKPVKEVISCMVTVQPEEVTVRSGGADCHLKAVLHCVYLVKNDDNIEYACTEKSFPLDANLESASLEEEFEGTINCYVKELSVSAAKDSAGENRVIEVDFTYDIYGRFFANASCMTIADLYSCDFVSELEHSPLTTRRFVDAMECCVPFHATLDAPHVTELLAPFASIQIKQVKYDDAEAALYADADVLFSAAQRGEDGRMGALSGEIPVRAKCSLSGDTIEHICLSQIKRMEARLVADSVEISGEVCVRVLCFETQMIQTVSSVHIDHTRAREDTSGLPITFYYPEDGELLWDIAKKYGSTEEMIRNANEISDDTKIGKSVLLIPCKRKKPLFSKVISK